MRFALVVSIIFSAGSAFAQTHEWGLTASVGFSRGRLPNGVGVGYAGPPFWAGNLVVEEQNVPGYSIEIFREQFTRWNRVSVKTGFGFLSCGAKQHFDYDYANSINNVVSVENRFHYITFNALAKYTLPVKKAAVFASIGPHFGYMIYSMETSTNYLPNGELTEGSFNFLSSEERFNYGPQYSIGARYKGMSIETFYRSYYKVPYHTHERRIISFGLAVSWYLKKRQ